ncbi:hypothetical protein V6N12_010704 [Hibiscus sabdariffa]|uniref:RNase H type-1 domain-containing protein n=1 Tax=Hibiscus sabdariffa TaxID=183260 RepID=A0ABR2EKW1_9ROSI
MPISGSWSAPDAACLKFNVDAGVKGSSGEAGIGGILCDHCGKALIRFSKSIGMSDPTGAELVAIHEACQVFSSSRWFIRNKLSIESDSLLAVLGCRLRVEDSEFSAVLSYEAWAVDYISPLLLANGQVG